jgi:PAS domain S-box-containing protein
MHLEEQESQYARSLIEASRDPLVTINTGGKITDMNQATLNITGKSREALTGTDFFDYFTEPHKAREIYKEVFAKGFVADYPLTIRYGKQTEVLFNGSVYRDKHGRVAGVVVVARDITEQKRTERELLEAIVIAELATGLAEDAKSKADSARQVAEDAVKAKQQFLSNMSHEIRTPMSAILGFTKVLLRTDLTAKQKEYMSAIKVSGDALIVLINDILDLAKVDAGKMTFEQTSFKMSASISAMLQLFETRLQEKNLELIKAYDNRIPEVLVGDPVRLRQIILNLMSNAVKFTNHGRIVVRVSLLDETAEEVTVEFSVEDTGIGIEENKIEAIFENFQQASRAISRLYGGTGLGLAIVKNLVEAQGGKIEVTSTPDQGSMFRFTLNFLKTSASLQDELESIEIAAEVKGVKILVVEDIPLNQLLIKTLLDDFGFESEYAFNGRRAVEMLSETGVKAAPPFQLILMDLQMPEMDGFETTTYIRQIMKSNIPIIALSADVTTVDLEKCLEAGMNDYVTKPVDEKLLFSKIVSLSRNPVQVLITKPDEVAPETTRYVNLEYLTKRTKANSVMMREMISLYMRQTPDLVSTARKALLTEDWSTMRAAVHKIIPSLMIMGIGGNCETIARQILKRTHVPVNVEEVRNLVLELETICNGSYKELEEELLIIKN